MGYFNVVILQSLKACVPPEENWLNKYGDFYSRIGLSFIL